MALPEELNKLLEAGVHFGHQAKRWNPKMKKFIFGKRSGIYIINLEKTLEKINEAKEFLIKTVKEGGVILFLGTKKQAQGVIKEVAEQHGMPYVIDRWVGGLLTNFGVIRGRVERYKKLLQDREGGNLEMRIKKEVVRLNKEIEKMERNFMGVKEMDKLPAVLFVVDPKKELMAVKEAHTAGIPIVALIDTDSDPNIIDYPIPCNDDALKSVKTILSFVMAPLAGIIEERKKLPEAIAPAPAEKEQESEEKTALKPKKKKRIKGDAE